MNVQTPGPEGAATRAPLPKLSRVLILAGLAGVLALFAFGYLLFPGNLPLYKAIDRGDEGAVRELLRSGADPNSQSQPFLESRRATRYRSPSLAFALWKNCPGIALLLLEAGADPNARHDGA